MNIISNILSYIKGDNKNNAYKDMYNNFTILPENIRYAMKYSGAKLGKEEVASLLHISFGFCGLYIIMKFYNNDIHIQSSILSILLESNNDYNLMYKKLYNLHGSILASHTIIGEKIATLSKYNFNGLDSKFDIITEQLNINTQEPIILLYAGILGLPSLLQGYKGNTIRLFNSNNPIQSFKIKKEGQKRTVSKEIIKDIGANHVLIDDMYNTGKAYNKALEDFSILGYNYKIPLYTAINIK